MKFLLIYNIFFNTWYAEHVMNHEYLQTDGIGGRSEQCSHFSALVKSSTHTHHRQWEYKYKHTVPPFSLYMWHANDFATMKKYYFSLFMAIYLTELHSKLLFSNEVLCPSATGSGLWKSVEVIFKTKERSHFREHALKPFMMDVKLVHYLPTYKVRLC